MDRETIEALGEALDDEYKARATYRAVLERFGDVRPFSRIVHAEQRHIDALLELYRRYELTPVEDSWTGSVEAPDSLEEACETAVQAEIDNDEMYERLLAVVSEPEIRIVMERLREASRDRHLPAFRRCLERKGGGRGTRRRRRGR